MLHESIGRFHLSLAEFELHKSPKPDSNLPSYPNSRQGASFKVRLQSASQTSAQLHGRQATPKRWELYAAGRMSVVTPRQKP
eukprot:291906-Chlamydomonas_euryale.AAC.4